MSRRTRTRMGFGYLPEPAATPEHEEPKAEAPAAAPAVEEAPAVTAPRTPAVWPETPAAGITRKEPAKKLPPITATKAPVAEAGTAKGREGVREPKPVALTEARVELLATVKEASRAVTFPDADLEPSAEAEAIAGHLKSLWPSDQREAMRGICEVLLGEAIPMPGVQVGTVLRNKRTGDIFMVSRKPTTYGCDGFRNNGTFTVYQAFVDCAEPTEEEFNGFFESMKTVGGEQQNVLFGRLAAIIGKPV